MTASELIRIYDEERRNQIESDTKLRWLKNFEMLSAREVFDTHEFAKEELQQADGENGIEAGPYAGYGFAKHFMNFDYSTELLIPAPYDRVYLDYLDMQANQLTNEQERYNMAANLFNTSYTAWQQYWNRTHKPKGTQPRFFDHQGLL